MHDISVHYTELSIQEGCQVPPLTMTEGSSQSSFAEAPPRTLWTVEGLGLWTCTDTAALGARAESEWRHEVDRKAPIKGPVSSRRGGPMAATGEHLLSAKNEKGSLRCG